MTAPDSAAVLAADAEIEHLRAGGEGDDHLARLLAAMREWARQPDGERCWHPTCTRPGDTGHYHCAECNSPRPTSMFGHYTEHGFTCATGGGS